MNLVTKALYFSLIIVWISIFVKYKSTGFLSRSNYNLEADYDQDSGQRRFRFRQTFRKGYEKVVDKAINKEKVDNKNSDDAENTRRFSRLKNEFRRSSTEPSLINGQLETGNARRIRKIKDKFRRSTQSVTPQFQPGRKIIGTASITDLDYIEKYKPENFLVPYKPGDKNYSILIKIARNIIKSGNYSRSGFNNHNYQEGIYNNYKYRSYTYDITNRSICSNYLEYGGVVFGRFYCPVEGYSTNSVNCCGAPNEEYCCKPLSENEMKLSQKSSKNSNLILIYFFIFLPSVIFVVIVLAVVLILRYKGYLAVKKDDDNDNDNDDNAK